MDPAADAQPDDVELMRRFQEGHESAYDSLVLRHHPFVVRHARRYLGDDPSVDDVAQEVFIRLYRSAHLFRNGSNFRGWLATMTSRLALNEIRTRRRKRWLPRSSLTADTLTGEWRPAGSAGPETPEEVFARGEMSRLVQAAIARLPERQRVALWLQRFEGWELEDLGSALGLSLAAVKSLLFRARQSLRKELEASLGSRPLTGASLLPSEKRS